MNNFLMVAVGLLAGFGINLSVFAAGKVSVGEKLASSMTIPVILTCEEHLSCLSLTMTYTNDAIDANRIKLNEERFPWKNRAVTISVDEDKREIVFTVVDLVGQNIMVAKGEGVLLSLPLDAPQQEVIIAGIQAFNENGESVEIGLP